MADKPDRWTAIGIDRQVAAGSSNPVLLDGVALAMWRPEDGPVNVWEDRCPHRGMRLSYGFVRGDVLRCIYHGWGYQSGGQCISIPAHPELAPPRTICANAYPSATRYGLVWTNLKQDTEKALPDVGDPERWGPVRSIYVNRSERDVRAGVERLGGGGGGAGMDTLIDLEGDGTLMLAVQPVDGTRTALHGIASCEGMSEPAGRLALAGRMVWLRGALEAR